MVCVSLLVNTHLVPSGRPTSRSEWWSPMGEVCGVGQGTDVTRRTHETGEVMGKEVGGPVVGTLSRTWGSVHGRRVGVTGWVGMIESGWEGRIWSREGGGVRVDSGTKVDGFLKGDYTSFVAKGTFV